MRDEVFIVPFEPWHLTVMSFRDEQKQSSEKLEKEVGLIKYGDGLSNMSVDGCAYSAILEGYPIACAGIAYATVNIGEAWSFFDKKFFEVSPRTRFSIYKTIKSHVKPSSGLTRIQAMCEENFCVAQSWLKKLGLQYEGTLKGYGLNGEDLMMFGVKI